MVIYHKMQKKKNMIDDVAVADADADAVAELKVALVATLGMLAGIESASGLDVVVILALNYLVGNNHLLLIRTHHFFYVVCQKRYKFVNNLRYA